MANASINVVASLAGQTIPIQISRQDNGTGLWTPTVPAAVAPQTWTKTDNTNGTAAFASTPSFVTGDKVDVFWSGGRRYNMAATVTGNSVALSGGGGDNLPASGTAVLLAERLVVNVGFDPDDVTALMISTARRASVVFADAGGAALLALDLPAGGCCLWWSGSGISRPFSGNPVAGIWVANGDGGAMAADVVLACLYNATP
jgi:hypothetical protein